MAEGDFISFLDRWLSCRQCPVWGSEGIEETSADFIYTDEIIYTGKLNIAGNITKPDFSPDYLRVATTSVIWWRSAGTAERTGMMDSEMDGSQDYDFVLRATESADKIHHIDEPSTTGGSWRQRRDSIDANPYAYLAAKSGGTSSRQGRPKGEVIKSIAVPCSI